MEPPNPSSSSSSSARPAVFRYWLTGDLRVHASDPPAGGAAGALQPLAAVGEPFLRRVHPEDHGKVAEGVARLRAGLRDAVAAMYRRQAPDGAWAWCHTDFFGEPSTAPAGGAPVVVAQEKVLMDAGRCERLRDQSASLRELAEHHHAVFFQLDAQGRFLVASGLVGKQWGYEPAELVGTPCWAMVAEEDRPAAEGAFQFALLGKQTPPPIFVRRRRRDGTYVAEETRLAPAADGSAPTVHGIALVVGVAASAAAPTAPASAPASTDATPRGTPAPADTRPVATAAAAAAAAAAADGRLWAPAPSATPRPAPPEIKPAVSVMEVLSNVPADRASAVHSLMHLGTTAAAAAAPADAAQDRGATAPVGLPPSLLPTAYANAPRAPYPMPPPAVPPSLTGMAPVKLEPAQRGAPPTSPGMLYYHPARPSLPGVYFAPPSANPAAAAAAAAAAGFLGMAAPYAGFPYALPGMPAGLSPMGAGAYAPSGMPLALAHALAARQGPDAASLSPLGPDGLPPAGSAPAYRLARDVVFSQYAAQGRPLAVGAADSAVAAALNAGVPPAPMVNTTAAAAGTAPASPAGSTGRRRARRNAADMACAACRTTKSLEWRRGPDGSNSLCNACGLRYARLQKHLARVAAANASTEAGSGGTAGSGRSSSKPDTDASAGVGAGASAASSASPPADASTGSERASASPTPSAGGADGDSRPTSPSLPSPRSITESVKLAASPRSADALPVKAAAPATVDAPPADDGLGKVEAPAEDASKGNAPAASRSPVPPVADAAPAAAPAAELAA